MKNKTRLLYGAMLVAMATAYDVPGGDTTQKFEVSELLETAINTKVQESSDFLQMITVSPVEEMEGQALEFGPDGLIAGRTDTDKDDRAGTELGGPNGSKWKVAFTEFDVFIKYHTLDLWARIKDFHNQYMGMVYNSIALDRITIGFYGTEAAKETDKVANPLGQDVNKGWFQVLREQSPDSVMTGGARENKIYIGAHEKADYQNLDAFVADLYQGIPVEHRTGNEVVVVGSALVAADTNKVLNQHAGTPSEKSVGITTLTKSYGGLTAVQVPRFPANGVFVGDLKHLHLYYQEGRSRRATDNNSKRSRVEDYISSNDAYAIGNMKAVAFAEPDNVEIVDKSSDVPDAA